MQNRIVEFEESKSCDTNITIGSINIHTQEKKTGTKKKEKDDHQVNTYNKSEASKST